MASQRSFRARVTIYAMSGERLLECACLLITEVAPFARTTWSGYLSEKPALSAGRYRMRFPNGHLREIDVDEVEAAGLAFTGIGSLPMP